ncbi:MAG: methyltransferase [Bacteroidota bacterium]|nr:methyltransferase [Bacteroidota bacterium]MEC8636475.1 methyltransferase [Bacteroidota bacterium]
MYKNNSHRKRFQKTLDFLNQHIDPTSFILDLGIKNPLSELMQAHGHKVENTHGEDLDENQTALINSKAEVVTAFEILEHLLSPYQVLKSIKANKLVASVPLKLWFSRSYRSKADLRDRHFHEFEDWQFDWLLEKTGWRIVASQKWINPPESFGFRSLLRYFTPRHYIVYAEKINA